MFESLLSAEIYDEWAKLYILGGGGGGEKDGDGAMEKNIILL